MEYNLSPAQTASETVSLDIFNEELSTGNYRIIKEFREADKEYRPENQTLIAIPFEVVE